MDPHPLIMLLVMSRNRKISFSHLPFPILKSGVLGGGGRQKLHFPVPLGSGSWPNSSRTRMRERLGKNKMQQNKRKGVEGAQGDKSRVRGQVRGRGVDIPSWRRVQVPIALPNKNASESEIP